MSALAGLSGLAGLRRRRPGGQPGSAGERTTWQLASLLLDYPDDTWADRLALVGAESGGLPSGPRKALSQFVAQVGDTDPVDLRSHYVDTFDSTRRCCLYLTYYGHGDTRQRGMALLQMKQAYRASGVELLDSELPDHLGVLLEFAATADPVAGRRLLVEHRAGVELLRLALHERPSPWGLVLDAVSATLPVLAGDQRAAVARLAAQGPPAEQVGLQPFEPPGGPVPLPMPTVLSQQVTTRPRPAAPASTTGERR